MRKLVCIVICLVMMLQCVGIFADDSTDKELMVLNQLNIITDEEIENSGQSVTRAEFVQYAAKALMMSKVENKIYFKDVPVEYWASGYINAFVESGIIDLATDGYFNPEASVTPEQAYKIMLVALGYKEYALSEAEIMTAYAMAARKTGIDIQTQTVDSLSLYEAAKIIFNAMEIGQARIVGMDGSNVKKQVFPDDTLFAAMNIACKEGRVTAVYGASADESIKVEKEGYAYIDNEKFAVAENVDISAFFGHNVEIIYENKSDDKVIIYAVSLESTELIIDTDSLKGFEPDINTISYYRDEDSGKSNNIQIPKTAEIIVNGQLYSGRLYDIMNEFLNGTKHGKIKLIKSQAGYNTVIIESYRTIVAKGYNSGKEVFFDYYSAVNNVDLSEMKYINYITPDGLKSSMPTSFPVVLEVAESADGESVQIIVCDKQVSGEIGVTYGSEQEIQIGEESFEVQDFAWEKFGSALRCGTNIKALLDSFGKIVYVEAGAGGGMQIGYLTDIAIREDVFNNVIIFKLYTNGAIHTYELADKLELDGEKYEITDYKKFFLKFPLVNSIGEANVDVNAQIIRYTLNDEGKINGIDSTNLGPDEDKDNSLKMIHDGSNALIYNGVTNRFGMDTFFSNTQTSLFVLPQGIRKDGTVDIKGTSVKVDEGMYSTSKSFTTDYTYYLTTYDFDSTNPYTDIIVVESKPLLQDNNTYMFNQLIETINSDGESVTAIECYSPTGIVALELHDSLIAKAQTLEQGDLIVVDADLTGRTIYGLERCFIRKKLYFDDASEYRTISNQYWHHGTFNPYGNWSFRDTATTNRQISKAYPYEIVGSIMKSCYEYSDLADEKITEALIISNIPIIVYDSGIPRENKIYQGTSADIETFVTAGYECSTIVSAYNGLTTKCIFVYK